ncbi:CvpA family protein [Amaricoccus sp.]|uniref:CvpA family protein n=1 Tax=Amaricoccus sp. TaxID=1872485 RepID=UPI001B4D2E62|nr:CvpA family protein [Amaricoccus sp.]MBP7241549.1 CvpA family protein [Amaricoccus sp.]
MDGFNIVDGIALAIVVVSAVLAWSRGFVREALAIAGWIVAAVAAFAFAPAVEPLVREVPVLRDVIGGSCELGVLAGFVAVFAVALIVVSVFTPLLSGAVQNSAIGPIDQGLGLVFGAARGVALIAIAFVVYDRILGGAGGAPIVDASYTRTLFAGIQADLAAALPDDAPQWIAGQYERLVGSCAQAVAPVTPETPPASGA